MAETRAAESRTMQELAVGDTDPRATSPRPALEPARPRRRWPWLVATAVVAVAGVVAYALMASATAEEEQPEAVVNTAEVVRTDLVEVAAYDGTLGRSEGDPVSSAREETLTGTAPLGATVTPGDVAFRIDDEPVVVLDGKLPAYRDMALSEGVVEVTASGAGTFSQVPRVGDVVTSGDVLYVAGGDVRVVLNGRVPAWRDIDRDTQGTDVEQLEQALVDLGYDPGGTVTIDEDFTGYTEAMVRRWQDDIGLDEDGTVELGEVLFFPGPVEVRQVDVSVGDALSDAMPAFVVGDGVAMTGDDIAQLAGALDALGFDAGGDLTVDGTYDVATHAAVAAWENANGATVDGIVSLGQVVFHDGVFRVSEVLADPGSALQPGTAVVATTSAEIVVSMDLPAADQGTIGVGDPVTIELPDGTETAATVSAIDAAASVSDTNEAVFAATITLDEPSIAGGLDEAPVDVVIPVDGVEGVLAVPVTALVALAEGGYAIEVVDMSGATRLVAADPGFFADGMVEIDADIEPGAVVVVP